MPAWRNLPRQAIRFLLKEQRCPHDVISSAAADGVEKSPPRGQCASGLGNIAAAGSLRRGSVRSKKPALSRTGPRLFPPFVSVEFVVPALFPVSADGQPGRQHKQQDDPCNLHRVCLLFRISTCRAGPVQVFSHHITDAFFRSSARSRPAGLPAVPSALHLAAESPCAYNNRRRLTPQCSVL